MAGLTIDPEAEAASRPSTPSLGISSQLGAFFPLLPKQKTLILDSEEKVAVACKQLHEQGLWSCLVRSADGTLRFFELADLCARLLDALHTDSVVTRVIKVLGACSVGDLAQKEPIRPVLASTPLADVLERLVAESHEKVVVAGEGGEEVQRVFACSDLLELLLRYARGSCHVFQEPARRVLAEDLEGRDAVDTADPNTPVLQCFQTLRERGHGGLVLEDNSDPRQSLLERALGIVTMADVQYFFLRPSEEAARWASCSVREFVALEMRELRSPRAGAGASHYPFIHADVEQSVEVLISKLLSSRAYCIALCSPSEGALRIMVRAFHVVRAIRSQLTSVVFEKSDTPRELVSSRSWPSPMAGPSKAPLLPPELPELPELPVHHGGALVRRVSWKDDNGSANLASVHEFEMDGTPKKAGSSMVLALEDGDSEDSVRIPRPPNWTPQMGGSAAPQLPLLPPAASPSGSGAGTDQQLPHHHHILSVLALEDPALQEPLEACESSRWRQLGQGPEGADSVGPHSHRSMGMGQSSEQLQLVLYQKRELVLYDRSRNRAFARRLTDEQANLIACNQQSFCPLCRQRLNPSWAFVVEGYFEMLSAMAPAAPAASAGSDDEAAAACGLHSIPMGLLNTGYYSRFFVEDRKLGSGSFGAVYLCRHVMDEIELGVFAVKKLALGDDTKRLRQVMREVKALERLRHMNIIDYKHSWLEVSRHSEFCPYVPFLFILMEFCNAGSLENLIWPEPDGFIRGAPDNVSRSSVLSEELIWLLFLDVCRGLRHLHSRSILHRDLKPSNILLHVDDTPNESASVSPQNKVPRAILSDFGTCEILGEGVSVGGGHVHNAYAIEFSAPERLSGEESDEPADMWSAGLVLYAMAYGDLPYHSEDPATCREKVIAHTVLSDLPEWRDSALRGLISALTARAPVARPTAEEAERVSATAVANRTQSPTSSNNSKASAQPQLLPPEGLPLTLLDAPLGSAQEVPSPANIVRITSASSLSDAAASDTGASMSTSDAEDPFMTSMNSLNSFGRASP